MFLHLEHSAQTHAIAEMLSFHAEHNAHVKLSVGDVEHMIASDAKGDA